MYTALTMRTGGPAGATWLWVKASRKPQLKSRVGVVLATMTMVHYDFNGKVPSAPPERNFVGVSGFLGLPPRAEVRRALRVVPTSSPATFERGRPSRHGPEDPADVAQGGNPENGCANSHTMRTGGPAGFPKRFQCHL